MGDGGHFNPEDEITREQAALLLARAAGLTGSGTADSEAVLSEFVDAAHVSEWALVGVAACVRNGLMQGRCRSMLVPGGFSTRAETVTLLCRFLQPK